MFHSIGLSLSTAFMNHKGYGMARLYLFVFFLKKFSYSKFLFSVFLTHVFISQVVPSSALPLCKRLCNNISNKIAHHFNNRFA